MKPVKVMIEFKGSHVYWIPAEKDAPIYRNEHSKMDGKPYKWIISVNFGGFNNTFYSFISPSVSKARKLIQNFKEQKAN